MTPIVAFVARKLAVVGCEAQCANILSALICTGAVIISALPLCLAAGFAAKRIVNAKTEDAKRKRRFDLAIGSAATLIFFWICASWIPQCCAGFPVAKALLAKGLDICVIIFSAKFISAFVDCLALKRHRKNSDTPFTSKTLVQVCKIIIWSAAAIVIVSRIMDKSPTFVLSGLGALTAILMLVFKDSILGLVAGIQVSQNDMVRIGDWITMPKYNADGTVIDIALTTVKVQNFDNTVTMIPSSVLISDAFVNWRYMSDSKGRRIKRAVFISASSILPAGEAFVKRLISENLAKPGDTPTSNLAAFETWLERFLANDERISDELTCMVRQITPTDTGIPIEVYAFTKTRDWLEYEKIQSDIFDRIYITVPRFGLRIYQRTGDNGAPFEQA